MNTPSGNDETNGKPVSLQMLAACGIISWIQYFILLRLSLRFEWGVQAAERPLLFVLGIFAALFGVYLFAFIRLIRGPYARGSLPLIIVFSVAFRLLMLFSEPIQEIDAYRYIWDGKVAAAGVNPFRYSPHQVHTADAASELPVDLARLVKVRDRSPANATILSRIHYAELTTVYPPVSQMVFATVELVTPDTAPVATQMLILKSSIVLFDLATLALVVALLRFVGKPVEWSILYGWCPLIIKEFANSGHLDSIAVFFSTAAVLCALNAFFFRAAQGVHPSDHASEQTIVPDRDGPANPHCIRWFWLCSLCITAAVGAKIYPVVLFPLLFMGAWRAFSLTRAVSVASVTALLCSCLVAPMFYRNSDVLSEASAPATSQAADDAEHPPLPDEDGEIPRLVAESTVPDSNSNTGLAAFASHWQMNDFLFALLFENLRPDRQQAAAPTVAAQDAAERDELPPVPGTEAMEEGLNVPEPEPPTETSGDTHPAAWFVVTPNAWRNQLVDAVSNRTGVSDNSVPFLVTRFVTSGIFLIVAIWLAICTMKRNTAEHWLRAGFLTIAWFWMLQPTQNPWYWTWAMPLLPFARSRAWLAVSGIVLIYYVRFWLSHHFQNTAVGGTPYHGKQFFDDCVTWVEFAPVLMWLMIDQAAARIRSSAESTKSETFGR